MLTPLVHSRETSMHYPSFSDTHYVQVLLQARECVDEPRRICITHYVGGTVTDNSYFVGPIVRAGLNHIVSSWPSLGTSGIY